MAIDSVHPAFAERSPDWAMMRDLYRGERVVKSKAEVYLPATKSMKLDGMGSLSNGTYKLGQEVYEAYKIRAVFPDYVKDAVEGFIGVMHAKPPTIKLPSVMEPLRKRCTVHGESMELLLRRINEEQLVSGRIGLLLDLPINPDQLNPLPYIATYNAESIRNWDAGDIGEGIANLNLVVLDESGVKRQDSFEWTTVTKYRILQLGALNENETSGIYRVGVFETDGKGSPTFDETLMTTPRLRGKVLDEIPFIIANTKDIMPTPDEAPLAGLGRLALVIYRGEADYRQNLFMQGQDTLIIIGDRKKVAETPGVENAPVRTGAGSLIELEATGDAKYIGVNSQGLAEQRQALEQDRRRAENKAGQLIDPGKSGDAESGKSLNVRIGAQTATLHQIAQSGAAALEAILKICARWMNADPNEVSVVANDEFIDFELTGDTLLKLMQARALGAPLSIQSVHGILVDRKMTKLTYEEELAARDAENTKYPNLALNPLKIEEDAAKQKPAAPPRV